MIEDLKKRLLEGDEEERRVAVEALGGLREKEAVLLLVSALGDKSWRVRKTSEEILEGFAGEESLVPALIGSLRSEDNAKQINFVPSVRWNITKRSYIDLSYQIIRSESKLQKTNSQVISSNLKIFF